MNKNENTPQDRQAGQGTTYPSYFNILYKDYDVNAHISTPVTVFHCCFGKYRAWNRCAGCSEKGLCVSISRT